MSAFNRGKKSDDVEYISYLFLRVDTFFLSFFFYIISCILFVISYESCLLFKRHLAKTVCERFFPLFLLPLQFSFKF